MKGLNILVRCLVLLILSGCGTFTKMRYSHGFKSNIEFSFRNKTGKVEELKASKAIKKTSNKIVQPENFTLSSIQKDYTHDFQNKAIYLPTQNKITVQHHEPIANHFVMKETGIKNELSKESTQKKKNPRETIAYTISSFFATLLIFGAIDIIILSIFVSLSDLIVIICLLSLLFGILIFLILKLINQIYDGNYSVFSLDSNFRLMYYLISLILILIATLLSKK